MIHLIFKILGTLTLSLCIIQSIFAQIDNPNFDEALAAQFQADDYGMKKYYLVILKTGTNQNSTKEFRDSCFVGHMANINRMVEAKKLIVAGPLGKNELSYRGIFILSVGSLPELEELLLNDPAIKENLLATEILPWYGSAALPAYLDYSDKIWKIRP